ncbi:MAG: hypothetical protein HC822_09900 [Oscillochloris sp.]|nr:hypothetical protein [Oscillochloris sp.]
MWYTLNGPGWQDGGLLDANQQPRPAFEAFLFLRKLLSDAEFIGVLSSDVYEGYAFRANDKIYEIYWTNDSSEQTLALPQDFRAAYNPLGQPIEPDGGLIVSFAPIVIERGLSP